MIEKAIADALILRGMTGETELAPALCSRRFEHCISASRKAKCGSEPRMNFSACPVFQLGETFSSNSR